MSERSNFFLIHLVVSIVIVLTSMGIIFLMWYPAPLAKATGALNIFLMILVISIIVGPILGLYVYKEHKKSLKLDLSIIILMQLISSCYGFYTILQGRPVWIVYSIDRFQLIRKNDVVLSNNISTKFKYNEKFWMGPHYVAVKLSDNAKQKESDMFNAVSGLTLAQQPERYIPFKDSKSSLLENTLSLTLLNCCNSSARIKRILGKYPQANGWIPLKANAVDMVVLINKDSANVVKIVDLRPWN